MFTRWAALVAAAMLAVPGVAGAASATPEADRTKGISWQDCAERDADPAIRCAKLTVPADWHRPGGTRTTIGLAKLPAKNPERRVGSLLINLGGDGASAQHLPDYRRTLAELTNWYDVIAFDTRGMGTSSGVTCPTRAPSSSTLWLSMGQQAWQRFERSNREWEANCQRALGPLAGNLDAWQVAHDMDAIRSALGEDKLTYYGNSNGTVLGQAYAELFPTNVRRMFLDSTLDHTEPSLLELTAPMASGIRDKFEQFGRWCETSRDCALYPSNGRQVWDELMAQARQQPLPAPGAGPGKTVGPDQLRFETFNLVFDRERWATFANALAKARAGDAGDFYAPPPPTRSDATVGTLIHCADFPFRQSWDGIARLERQLREIAPRVGWMMARGLYAQCAGLRHQGTFPPHRIEPRGMPPALIVNGMHDHLSPPAWGRAVAEQLPGSVWIGANASHAVYLNGNRCVRDTAHRYLLTGELPTPGSICPANGR